jgi:glycosyltransferase involved in cell wall biosynthesis
MTLHVLHTIPSIIRGGAENHLADLATTQARNELQVTVAYLKSEPYWEQRLREAGVRVVPLGLRYYGDPRPIVRLRRLIAEEQPSLIHAHMPPAELYTWLALQGISASKIPLVISKHNSEPFYQGYGQQQLARVIAQRASRIITISQAVKNYHCTGPGIGGNPAQFTPIHYGFDPAPYEHVSSEVVRQVRREWGISDETYVIGTVARLVPQKALHVLLQGFAHYTKQTDSSTRLVIVGRGPQERVLKQCAAHLGIHDQVVWAGFRDDIPVIMRAFDVFALTSAWEGFGLVFLEAMAAATPIVATDIDAVPEVVLDQQTGFLFPPGRADVLARIMHLCEQPEVRRHLGQAGYRRLQTEFTIPKMVYRTLQVYEECLARQQTPCAAPQG